MSLTDENGAGRAALRTVLVFFAIASSVLTLMASTSFFTDGQSVGLLEALAVASFFMLSLVLRLLRMGIKDVCAFLSLPIGAAIFASIILIFNIKDFGWILLLLLLWLLMLVWSVRLAVARVEEGN